MEVLAQQVPVQPPVQQTPVRNVRPRIAQQISPDDAMDHPSDLTNDERFEAMLVREARRLQRIRAVQNEQGKRFVEPRADDPDDMEEL